MWIDKNHYLTQKSTARLTVKSSGYGSAISANPLSMITGQQQEMPISASVKFSKFNETVTVDAPKDAVKFDDLMKTLMPQMQTQTQMQGSQNNFASANDTKRRSDIVQIINAIGAYEADNKGALPKNMPFKGAAA